MPVPPPSLDPTWHPSAREDVEFRTVGSDWILFDPAAQRVHVVDVTAALVWSRCSGTMDVGTVEAEVRNALGAAFQEGSVALALVAFREAGLVR